MLGWLIEIRNFFLAISLAWIGVAIISAPAPEPEPEEAPTAIASIVSGPGLAFLLRT